MKGTRYGAFTFDSVISLILKYYGNSTVYKTWTSWTTIKKWATSSTASKISFYGSPSLQNTYYGGVLNEYTATTDGKLNKVGDCIKFEATTYKYPSATWSYTYTVDQ